MSVAILAALLTSYHTHRQTLVFLFVLFAAFAGRALRPGTNLWLALTWLTPVIGLHLWTVYLRNEIPIRFYPIQKYQTTVDLALLLVLCAALLIPALARKLAGWPISTMATAAPSPRASNLTLEPAVPRQGMTEAHP